MWRGSDFALCLIVSVERTAYSVERIGVGISVSVIGLPVYRSSSRPVRIQFAIGQLPEGRKGDRLFFCNKK